MRDSLIRVEAIGGEFAIARLEAADRIPEWARLFEEQAGFVSVTRTQDELSIVAPAASVPSGVRSEGPFRCIRVSGPLPFDAVGILASLTAPIAAAGIPLFTVSTYDTDYIFVHEERFPAAIEALAVSGIDCLSPR